MKQTTDNPNQKDSLEFLADFLDGSEVASAGDCTGLMPILPENEDETESYRDIYPVPEQDIEGYEELDR